MLSEGQDYFLHRGDCIPFMAGVAEPFAGLAVYSPPFPSVYAYTSSPADIGNSEDLRGEARLHFSFFLRAIRRAILPGRVMVVHCTNIVRMKRSGGSGVFDFRGMLIRLAERAGFIFEYEWAVRKNPQAQAIRTKSRDLQFAGLESDRAQSRGALPDYLLKFQVPGENAVPVRDYEIRTHKDGDYRRDVSLHPRQVTRNDWIKWAEYCWDDIRETDTLNVAEGRGPEDTKHIAPLQLGVIERIIRLYSNPDEIVFSPFAGIGSEGFVALKLGRRFVGCELKKEYQNACVRNLDRAIRMRRESERTLFDAIT